MVFLIGGVCVVLWVGLGGGGGGVGGGGGGGGGAVFAAVFTLSFKMHYQFALGVSMKTP